MAIEEKLIHAFDLKIDLHEYEIISFYAYD